MILITKYIPPQPSHSHEKNNKLNIMEVNQNLCYEHSVWYILWHSERTLSVHGEVGDRHAV